MTHHVLGSAEVVSGKAKIMYRLPAGLVGKTVSLQATAAGKGYLATSSSLCQARVTSRPGRSIPRLLAERLDVPVVDRDVHDAVVHGGLP